jgi:ABC-type lipoprotein release transport system permease subunit
MTHSERIAVSGPTDPLLWIATAVPIVAAASLATIVPASHASRLDPATTLRAE